MCFKIGIFQCFAKKENKMAKKSVLMVEIILCVWEGELLRLFLLHDENKRFCGFKKKHFANVFHVF